MRYVHYKGLFLQQCPSEAGCLINSKKPAWKQAGFFVSTQRRTCLFCASTSFWHSIHRRANGAISRRLAGIGSSQSMQILEPFWAMLALVVVLCSATAKFASMNSLATSAASAINTPFRVLYIVYLIIVRAIPLIYPADIKKGCLTTLAAFFN